MHAVVHTLHTLGGNLGNIAHIWTPANIGQIGNIWSIENVGNIGNLGIIW